MWWPSSVNCPYKLWQWTSMHRSRVFPEWNAAILITPQAETNISTRWGWSDCRTFVLLVSLATASWWSYHNSNMGTSIPASAPQSGMALRNIIQNLRLKSQKDRSGIYSQTCKYHFCLLLSLQNADIEVTSFWMCMLWRLFQLMFFASLLILWIICLF